MTTRGRAAVLVAALVVVSLLSFAIHERRRQAAFRIACWAIRAGDAIDDAERRLADAGGVLYTASGRSERVWHIDAPLWRRIAICTIEIDEHGTVIWSKAKGNRPK